MRWLVKERAQNLLKTIESDILSNRLILPSLPEVAIRVRELAADPDCTVATLEREVAKDAAIAARLIKVANSSALQRGRPVTGLKQAIMSLGFNLVRSLVTQLAILQTMRGSKDTSRLQGFVASGLHISTLCHSLAARHTHLDAELAALGGLLHDIGKLPLRDFLLQQEAFSKLERLQFELVLHPYVGAMLLKHWGMTSELVQMARWHESILRETGNSQPDYIDVVIAANVLHYGTKKGRYAKYADIVIPASLKCVGGSLDALDVEHTEQRMQLSQALASA